VLVAGHWVADGLGLDLGDPRDLHRAGAPLPVDLEPDRQRERLAQVGGDRGEDLEEEAAVRPAGQGDERLALLGRRPRVHDQLARAVALVHRAREAEEDGEADAVQPDVAEVALPDLAALHRNSTRTSRDGLSGLAEWLG
jgi:hypothetical protein